MYQNAILTHLFVLIFYSFEDENDHRNWFTLATKIWKPITLKEVGFHRSKATTTEQAQQQLELELTEDPELGWKIRNIYKKMWVAHHLMQQQKAADAAIMLERKLEVMKQRELEASMQADP